jgi:hypothetical protein
VKQSKGTFKTIVLLPAFGAVAAEVFLIWAGRRHFSPILAAGLAAIITSTVAWVLGVLDLKVVTGWAATAFIVWWAIVNPADAGHLACNFAVFISKDVEGTRIFVASI